MLKRHPELSRLVLSEKVPASFSLLSEENVGAGWSNASNARLPVEATMETTRRAYIGILGSGGYIGILHTI